jgi:hypothetical protein
MNIIFFLFLSLLKLSFGLNPGSWAVPQGGWTTTNYLVGNQSLGPYPQAIPSINDLIPKDLPGWKQVLITNASIFKPLPNQGCPPGSPMDCVDYLSNGGIYPNCDPNMYGFSCGLPMSKTCMLQRNPQKSYDLYNITFVQNFQNMWDRYSPNVAYNSTRFILKTPSFDEWYSNGGSLPTELVFPIRWTSLKRKVIAVPQTAFIQDQLLAMAKNPALEGEWLMPDNNKITYAWYINGIKQNTFMKWITPGSITNPDYQTYSGRLYGLVLKLPQWATIPNGQKYRIEIPVYAWILTWNTLPNIDYSFSNANTYCSVQTAVLGPHCLQTGPGLQCFVSDLAPGTYCRASSAALSSEVTCYKGA